MRRFDLALVIALTAGPTFAQATARKPYFPPRGSWETRSAEQVGMDADRLAAAIELTPGLDSGAPRETVEYIKATLANEPHGEIVGPVRPRGDTNGIVIRRGYIVAEWGPTRRVDMTFSVTKTYLSTTVGLAFDRGMIRDLDDLAADYMPTDHFTSEHNAKITWDDLLRQTSDWRGTLWDKRDWADRPTRGLSEAQLQRQPLNEPGTRYEYNDVRVNLLALCALHVWRRPLPQVLRELVMDPIGASNTWRWNGYENSWITLDGLKMQSVSGGGHWGGGMFISTRDHARFGYLFLRQGAWDGKRIISEKWIELARTPGPANSTYGFMNWFLNTSRAQARRRGAQRGGNTGGRRAIPGAPETAVMFRGAGSNLVYVDWDNDLVIVGRWVNGGRFNRFVAAVIGAIEAQ